MKKFGLLATSVLLTISLIMYSRYYSKSVFGSELSQLSVLGQKTEVKTQLGIKWDWFGVSRSAKLDFSE